MDYTYVVLKPLRIGGEVRQPGELAPEAAKWHNLPAYISTGKIAQIPSSAVEGEDADVSKDELYELAQELDIEGRSSMSKEELEEAVKNAQASQADLDSQLEQYHAGGGWYELPGEEKKVRKDQARELLSAGGKTEE
jgi:hypothetical protein